MFDTRMLGGQDWWYRERTLKTVMKEGILKILREVFNVVEQFMQS